MQTNDREWIFFVFVVMLVSGLYALLNPKAVKKENEDVPGFHNTGFSWVPAWGWRLFGVVLLGVAGFCLHMFLTH